MFLDAIRGFRVSSIREQKVFLCCRVSKLVWIRVESKDKPVNLGILSILDYHYKVYFACIIHHGLVAA